VRAIKLLAVVGLAVALVAVPARAQQQVPIYRVQPPQVTRDSVLKLAREAFGMSSPQVTEDSLTFVLEQEQKHLTVWKASGSILYADNAKLWNPDYQITSPVDAEAAIQLAVHFLQTHNLLPPQALAPSAEFHLIKSSDGQSEVRNNWSVRWALPLDKDPTAITGGFRDEPVGAKLEVYVGQGGEIIGFHRFWREPGESRLVTALSPAEARELVAWKLQLAAPPKEEDIALEGGYDLLYPQDALSWLYPIYGARLAQDERIVAVQVPATHFSVLARITSPQPEKTFPPNTPIELRAEVRGGFGTPPYRFAWYSTVDGLVSQAATARVRLSPGLHQLTLIVTDRQGTLDTQTIFIAVEAPQQARLVAPLAWLAGALLLVGLLVRRTRRLAFLTLILLVPLLAAPWAGSSQAVKLPNCRVMAGAVNKYGCTVGKWNFGLQFTADDGLALRPLTYADHYVAYEIFFPYLEVEFTKAGAAPIVAHVEMGGGPVAGQVGVTFAPCGAGGTQMTYTNTYTIPLPAVPVNAGAANVELEVTQTWAFFTPAKGCASAPEFYPQLEYKLKNLGNLQAGVAFSKVRIFLRADFDVDGTVRGNKAGAERRDVSVIVRESIFEAGVVAGLAAAQAPPKGFYCSWDDNQKAIVGTLNPIVGRRGYVICKAADYGSSTENVNDFEVYHQADGALIVPFCTAPVINLFALPPQFFWTPCVHFHQEIGYMTGNNQLPGGGLPTAGWMARAKIQQRIYATQYNGAAPQREKEADPVTLMNGQALTDIVMWLVFEADQPQGLFFPYGKRRYPDHYGAFSCSQPTLTGQPQC
jgi:hypothetical protein